MTHELSLLHKMRVHACGYAISRQNNRVAFGLPYLLTKLFYIDMSVLRTDGRTYGHVITKISRIGRLSHFVKYGVTHARAKRARGGPL